MKRHGNLYAQICDIENLRVAYENARRGKTKTKPVIQVDKNPIGSFYGWLRYADTGRIINEYVLPAKSRVRSYIRELRQRLSASAPCQG